MHHLVPFKLEFLMNNNGSSPRWWRYACAGLKLEWKPFHIFHRWNICCQSFVPFESHTIFQYTAKRGYKQRLSSKTQMTNADIVQHFGRVWRSTWSWHTGEMLSVCELCSKAFSSEHTLKMLMKAHAGSRPLCHRSSFNPWCNVYGILFLKTSFVSLI